MKQFFIFLIVYIALGAIVQPAFADDFSLGVYPPILQIQATVPTIITKDITVVNASDNEENVRVVIRPFTASGTNNGQVSYLPVSYVPSPDKDIFTRVQILDEGNPVTALTLAPKQKRTLTLRIGLPKDEPGADYYFSILFMSTNPVDQKTNGSHIAAAIATNVLLSIGPKDETSGLLNEFSSHWFFQTGPVPFTVSISNTSRHFITPTGHILIRNMFGQLIGKVDLLPINILGNSTRFVPSKGNPVANGHPVALWNEKVLFGPYRANIVISLSDQGPIFTRTIYFFVMPIQYIIGLFLVVIIASIIAVRVHAHMNKI